MTAAAAGASGTLHTTTVEPLLGTRVTLRLRAVDEPAGAAAEAAAIGEIERLEALLSSYRPGSEWSLWRLGEADEAGPELQALLRLAAHWHSASKGAFHPGTGTLRARWQLAVTEQQLPSPAEMAELAAGITTLPYRIEGDRAVRTGDCSDLDLHAIAKGWIVDAAAATATAVPGVEEVLLNVGGDLLHRGDGWIRVGIDDPRRPFDNVPPMVRVRLRNAGLATGSGARRPLVVGGQRLSHVLDPRTGWPVQQVLSASVFAPDAATADVVATVVGVLPAADGVRFVGSLPDVGCCLLDAAGVLHRDQRWLQREGEPGT
ncbi:MAG: FAD:protein FMN transferase [Actinomycetota bacterium]|nr:FAD:protein FMN transferase [Actinomycetota bacterium]